jgi:hypothetical protein
MARTMQRLDHASSNGQHDRGTASSLVSVASPTKRKPTWVLFGALMVGLSAVIGAWVFAATSEQMSVVVAARDIEPGDVVAASDLRVIEMGRSGELRAVLSDQQNLVIGRSARGLIPAGTVLNTDLFGSADEVIPPGMVVVGASLESGAAPVADLKPGDAVELLGVQRTQSVPVGESSATQPSAVVLASGSVWSVEPPPTSSATAKQWVSVVVPVESQGEVAQAAADGLLRLSLIGGGR